MPAAGFSGVLVEAGPGGRPALFDGALETLTASDAESARAALARLEAARRAGHRPSGSPEPQRLSVLLEGPHVFAPVPRRRLRRTRA